MKTAFLKKHSGLVKPRSWLRTTLAFALIAGAVGMGTQHSTAQLSINWWTVDGGGGGGSTGENFSLAGTVGQPDAGLMDGDGIPFTVNGGFWALFGTAVPVLHIQLALPTGVVVWWLQPAWGWELQYCTDLATREWQTIHAPYTTDATRYLVPEPLPSGNKYYRLRKLL